MGVEIRVENLAKRFGRQTIWEEVSCTMPPEEISVMLGPSGTGKSVFLKCLIGLLKPETGSIFIDGTDITKVREKELYEIRKLFGVLFQDGALFGSQNLFDNIAFPLREHTRKSESDIKSIVLEKMEMTGLTGSEAKLPGEISGGMRKRAGLARALVLDPEILLFDEPDSGLDPVRTAYLNQLIVDLNAEIKATFLIVTHDISTARTIPDNIGLLYRRNLAMFGPREMLLSSNEPVVRQFLNGQRQGPIGMAEEKDAGELASEAEAGGEEAKLPPIPFQLDTSDGRQRSSQRAAGSWLREHGVVPPEGSFEGQDVDVPTASDGKTGWSGEQPPAPLRGNGSRGRSDGDGRRSDGRRSDGDGRRSNGDGRSSDGDGRRSNGDGRSPSSRPSSAPTRSLRQRVRPGADRSRNGEAGPVTVVPPQDGATSRGPLRRSRGNASTAPDATAAKAGAGRRRDS